MEKLTSRLLSQIKPGECIALGEAVAKETDKTSNGVSVEDWFQEKLKYRKGIFGPENFIGDFQWLDGDSRVRVTMGSGDYKVSKVYESGEMGTWLNDEGKLMVDISLLWKDFGLVLNPPVDYNPTRDTIGLTTILSTAFIFSDLLAVGASRMLPKVTKLLASPLSIGTGEIGLSAGGAASVLGGVSALTVGEVLEAVTAAAGVGALSAILSMAKVGNGGGEGDSNTGNTKHGDQRLKERGFTDEKVKDIKENYSQKVYQEGGRTVYAKKRCY